MHTSTMNVAKKSYRRTWGLSSCLYDIDGHVDVHQISKKQIAVTIVHEDES